MGVDAQKKNSDFIFIVLCEEIFFFFILFLFNQLWKKFF